MISNSSDVILEAKGISKYFGTITALENANLNLRPGELSNEMYYKITMKYEKLFD